jgi:hypothetical protein
VASVQPTSQSNLVLNEDARTATTDLCLTTILCLTGGHWPETVRRVAVRLSGSAEDPSQGVQLLADIQRTFEERRVDRLSSDVLCAELGKMEDRSWCDYADGFRIKPKQLSKLLKPFSISPKSHRIGDKTPRNYLLSDFEDPFARYLPASARATATPQHYKKIEDLMVGAPAT